MDGFTPSGEHTGRAARTLYPHGSGTGVLTALREKAAAEAADPLNEGGVSPDILRR